MKQPALGNTIATLRNQKGMTQKELAEACSVDIRSIQRIESGEVTPRMHTIRLLANTLGCDVSIFTSPAPAANNDKVPNADLKWPLFAAIVFSINAIPVVFDLITHAFNLYFHACALIVHAGSCIFFYQGFYLIGRRTNNPVLAVSSGLGMVLLPLVNIGYLVKTNYMIATYVLFILLCINGIIYGIGLLMEGHKRKNKYKINLYAIAGVLTIVQTGLFLNSDIAVVNTGLIISLLCNMVTATILYNEYNSGKRVDMPGLKSLV